jgi:hypothetical protein
MREPHLLRSSMRMGLLLIKGLFGSAPQLATVGCHNLWRSISPPHLPRSQTAAAANNRAPNYNCSSNYDTSSSKRQEQPASTCTRSTKQQPATVAATSVAWRTDVVNQTAPKWHGSLPSLVEFYQPDPASMELIRLGLI